MLAAVRLLLSVLVLASSLVGCELMVQLDRSAADAGEDAGCPICGDAGTEDAAEYAGPADSGSDAALDGSISDAPSDGPAPDGGRTD